MINGSTEKCKTKNLGAAASWRSFRNENKSQDENVKNNVSLVETLKDFLSKVLAKY